VGSHAGALKKPLAPPPPLVLNGGVIDSHCHLTYSPLLDQIDVVLRRATEAGVCRMVTVGTSIPDIERALALAAAHPFIHPTAGIHPYETGKCGDDAGPPLEALARRPEIVAVGETGLDYHYELADRAAQRRAFEHQMTLAVTLDKPLIIHCREAHRDVMEMLATYPRPERVVFHCFTGTPDEARELLERGFWFSLTGVVTFKNSDALREAARLLPDDRVMIETDSPYLSPEPVRSVRPNEPAHLIHTLRRLAAERSTSFDRLEALSEANTRRFFGLP